MSVRCEHFTRDGRSIVIVPASVAAKAPGPVVGRTLCFRGKQDRTGGVVAAATLAGGELELTLDGSLDDQGGLDSVLLLGCQRAPWWSTT